MKIAVDEFQHLLLVSIDVGTQCLVAIGTQLLDDTINHGRAEDVVLLECGTLAL